MKKIGLLCVLLSTGCAGAYIEAEHASNVYCGKHPFDGQCSETDWNSLGVGYRHSFDAGVYLDIKVADQIGTRELEGEGPHAYWKVGYQFK